MLFLKKFKDVQFAVDGSAFQTFITLSTTVIDRGGKSMFLEPRCPRPKRIAMWPNDTGMHVIAVLSARVVYFASAAVAVDSSHMTASSSSATRVNRCPREFWYFSLSEQAARRWLR